MSLSKVYLYLKKNKKQKTHLCIYIYVTKVLETLLGCSDFFDKIVFDEKNLSGNIKSFQDGKYYKDNKLLGQQNICICSLALYIDDFEVCNPLGTCRKLQKITAVLGSSKFTSQVLIESHFNSASSLG